MGDTGLTRFSKQSIPSPYPRDLELKRENTRAYRIEKGILKIYEDTTAQSNVVYYYQIEDVSLDGDRRTLTCGIRLRGHVGTAGKTTTLWGVEGSS